LIKDLIIVFSGIQRLGEITARVILATIISLQEHRSGSNKGSIGGNSELMGRIRVSEDWLAKEAIVQG
jgi:hypothetical protein